ncbi:MAG: hypothetical protein ACRDDZ_10805 [Marinifilaceae bacterium]
MKRQYSFLALMIYISVFLLIACNHDDKNSNSSPKISLSLNINASDLLENASSRTGVDEDVLLSALCPEQDAVFEYAQKGELLLNIEIYKDNIKLDIEPIEIKSSLSGLYTMPFEIDLGTYIIKYAELVHKTKGVLFRTITRGAPYSTFLEDTQLMDKTITYTQSDLYQKNSINLDLICSVDRDPYNFTYFLSEINVGKVYCFPFSINTCPEGQHIIGTGAFEVWTVKYINNNGVAGLEKDALFHSVYFDNSDGLSEICFKDDFQRDDEDEWLYLRLILDNNDPDNYYGSFVNVKRLKAFREEDEWNSTYNYMHIDFCENDTYIFEKEPNEEIDDEQPEDASDCFKEHFSRCNYPNWGSLTIPNLCKQKDIEAALTKKSFGIFRGSILRKAHDWHDRYLSLGVKTNELRLWSTPYIKMNDKSKVSLDVRLCRLFPSQKDKIELRLMDKNSNYVGQSVIYDPKTHIQPWQTMQYSFADFKAEAGEYRLVVICYIYGTWKIIGFDNVIICSEES